MKRRVFASMGALAALLAGGSAMARQIPAEIRHGGWSRAPLPEGDLGLAPLAAGGAGGEAVGRRGQQLLQLVEQQQLQFEQQQQLEFEQQQQLELEQQQQLQLVRPSARPPARRAQRRLAGCERRGPRDVRDGQHVQSATRNWSRGGGRGVPGAPLLQPSSWPRAGGGSDVGHWGQDAWAARSRSRRPIRLRVDQLSMRPRRSRGDRRAIPGQGLSA